MKTYLSLFWILVYFAVKSVAFEISGNAETLPETGVIKLQGKELLLNEVQIISENATCNDSNGLWSCGKAAWEALKNKLDSGSLNCKLISNMHNSEEKPETANCLLIMEDLSIWLVSRGWALKKKRSDELLSGMENLAKENNAGIWRDGFIPPDFWRTGIDKDSKNCNICSIRRQSFMRKTSKQKSN